MNCGFGCVDLRRKRVKSTIQAFCGGTEAHNEIPEATQTSRI